MKRVFGYGKKNIPYLNRLKRRIFYTIVTLAVMLNIFVAVALNLKNASERALHNPTLIIDIQHGVSEEAKNELEKKLLDMPEISAVRFMDKSESFKHLQDELNISIPEGSNPLYDSIIVAVKNSTNIAAVQDRLDAMTEVKEVYINQEYVDSLVDNGTLYEIICYGVAFIAVTIFIVSIFVFNLGVAIEFLNKTNVSKDYLRTLRNSKLKSLLSFTAASIIGFLIFLNAYIYLRANIIPKSMISSVYSWREIILYHLAIIFVLNFVVWIFPITIFKLGKEENEMEKKDEFEELFGEKE